MANRVSIFGEYSEPEEGLAAQLKDFGSELANSGITAVIGGNQGHPGKVAEGVVINGGRVLVMKTTAGRAAGVEVENVRGRLRGVYMSGGYGAKKAGLFHPSIEAHVVLPGQFLGTFTEAMEAVDQMASFDIPLKRAVRPVVFWGEQWETIVREQAITRVREAAKEEVLRNIKFATNLREVILALQEG